MNKLKMIISVVVFSFMSFAFVSCDDDGYEGIFNGWEDIDEANLLYGTWQGYLGTFYEDRWGVGGVDYITTLRFDKPSYGTSSGRGYEIDRRVGSPSGDYYYCEFRWMVDNDEIILIYDDDIYNPVYIYDYHLTRHRFRGYMDDGTNREIKFDLKYVIDFDWGPYYGTKPK